MLSVKVQRKGVISEAYIGFLYLLFLIDTDANGYSARTALKVYEEGPVWHMIYIPIGGLINQTST